MLRSIKTNKKYLTGLLLLSGLSLIVLALIVYRQGQLYGSSSDLVLYCYGILITNILILSLIARSTIAKSARRNRELFSLVLNGLNEGVYDYNVPEGTIYYSPSWGRMLGYDDKEVSNNRDNFYSLTHPDDLEQGLRTMHDYFERRIPTYYDTFRLRHKDGHWVWVMSRGIGVWGKDGKIKRLVGTHTDISIQKQREEELNFFMKENELQRKELSVAKEKAEAANCAKSDFLATMSHEIRTPTNVVVGLSSMLAHTKLDSRQKEMVGALNTNADMLLSLVNDLLDLSRIEAGQVTLDMHSFTFEEMCSSVYAIFNEQAAKKNLHFSITNNTGIQPFHGDPTRIQQILINLISNALKFTLQGSVAVTVDYEPLARSQRAQVQISVADTGVGIPPEKLSAVFEKFVQADQTVSRRFGGSGLGLSISKQLSEMMDGDILVTTEVGRGSTFTLSLPLELGKVQKIEPALEAVPSATTGAAGTVLVVEDYAANVMVVSMMLETFGYAVDVARQGREAIKTIEESKAPYTAILMDVQMQDMDGYETTRRIRAIEVTKGFRNFIIGVTAHAMAGDREKCLAAGMDDYMTKPINLDTLEQKIGQLAKVAA
jgi:PAS domain S-box-containing protein